MYDVLGWYSPTIIKIKILLQQLWVAKIEWDDLVPIAVQNTREKWKSELPRSVKVLYISAIISPALMYLQENCMGSVTPSRSRTNE